MSEQAPPKWMERRAGLVWEDIAQAIEQHVRVFDHDAEELADGNRYGVVGDPEAADALWELLRPQGPDIVTLCASMRLWPHIVEAEGRLIDEGAVVMAPLPHQGPVDAWVMATLDERHRARIDRSTRVVALVDHHGPGESVTEEIAYAESRGVPVEVVEVGGESGGGAG